jgi:hypothetical protein
MFRIYLSHLQALKGQIYTVSEQCVVESPTFTIIRLYSNEILRLLYNLIIVSVGDSTMRWSLIVWI